jgi:hypothetical protein
MEKCTKDTYHGWDITVEYRNNMCSNFSFQLVDPTGRKQLVLMGGDSEQRALERAREMIDLEIEYAGGEDSESH